MPSAARGEEDGGAGRELVEVAFTNEPFEAEMIKSLFEAGGIPSLLQSVGVQGVKTGATVFLRGPQRVMVHAGRAEEARTLLAKTLAENESADEAWPDIANAGYLEDAEGRKPRSYGYAGGFARIYLWSFGAIAVAFGIFMLLRVL